MKKYIFIPSEYPTKKKISPPPTSIFKKIVDEVLDYAIYMLDPQGYVLTWNQGAEVLKGYTKDEVIGQHYSLLFPDELRIDGHPENEIFVAAQEGQFKTENYRKRKDGSIFFASILLTKIHNDEGVHVGFTKVTRDLTESQEYKERLRAQNESLTKINADLDNFIYTCSHDLKAPILNIEGLANALKTEVTPLKNSKIDQLLNYIFTSIEAHKNVLTDLTTITKVQKNLEVGIVEEVNINDVLKEVDLMIHNDLKHHCPKISHNVKVETIEFSRVNLRTILYNLISNALKYRGEDRKCEVKVSTSTEKGYFVLSVEDNGIGIKEQDQDKIFGLFKRAHSHVDGTGVGLYIVKRIIENIKGRIELDSKPERGSHFRVYIPIQEIQIGNFAEAI